MTIEKSLKDITLNFYYHRKNLKSFGIYSYFQSNIFKYNPDFEFISKKIIKLPKLSIYG